MVERERERDGDGDTRALSGGSPPQDGGEKAEEEGRSEDDERKEEEEEEKDEEEEEEDKQQQQQEEEEEWSEIRLAVEELSPAKLNHGGGKPAASSPPTLPFLALSHLLLQVLDKIGPTMAVLRLDVQRNIERLQELYLLDPSKYSSLTEIVEKEVKEGSARKADSCARAVLWLTRSMDFTVALLQRLEEEGSESDQQSLLQLVEAAYTATLKPWHGWIASAAYKIAMKLVPERKSFTGLLLGTGQDWGALRDEIGELASLLQPLLDDIHRMMAKFRLDRLKST